VVLFLLTIPVALIPYVGRIGIFFLVAGMLLGFVHAAQGQKTDIPLIGDLAKGNMSMTDIGSSFLNAIRHGINEIEKLLHRKSATSEKKDPSETMDTQDPSPLP
jgi:hypothetical protein